MAKFAIMASELKSLKKSMEDRKLAELKKEIIEILKKHDEKDFKKAIDYFESQELHFTHLEKSLVSGKWVQKAGYGIGTVRIWKGKKYKKIAPGKWARVFDKEGRGTNIAIGKLIARVQKIDNVEDLMAFVMANKQRFVDENGVDLPVLDKLRAAVDARNGNVGSKEKTVEDKIKENPDYPFKPKTDKERAERAAFEKDRDDFIERMDKIRQENKKKDSKPAEKKEDDSKAYEGKLATQKQVDYATEISDKYSLTREEMLKKPITAIQKYANSTVEDFDGGIDKFIEYMADGRSEGVSLDEVGKEFGKLINHNIARKIWKDYESGALVPDEKGILKPKEESENKTYWIQDNRGNRLTNEDAKKKIIGQMKYLAELEDMAGKKLNNRTANDIRYYIDYLKDRLNPEDRKEVASEVKKEPETKDKLSDDAEIVLLNLKDWNKDEAQSILSKKINSKDDKNIDAYKEAYSYLNTHDMPTFKNGKIIDKESEDKEQQKIDMQMQLLELNKNRQDNNKNIKKLNSKLAELKQKKAEDEVRGNSVEKYDKEIKDTQKEIDNLLDDNYSIESKGTKIAKELNEMEKNGVKKSMFDDFVIDMFIDDEIEDEEELKEGETEYNDYSAEQPELFNSTSMKVREALDRIRNQVL